MNNEVSFVELVDCAPRVKAANPAMTHCCMSAAVDWSNGTAFCNAGKTVYYSTGKG